MKNKKAKRLLHFLFGLFIFVGATNFFSCYEDQEGCQDIAATNYDVAADVPCDDCCTYPSLTIQFSHRIGESSFQFDTPYFLDEDTTKVFVIEGMTFYLSGFHFEKGSQSVGVEDSIELFINGTETVSIEDNFSLIDRNEFTAELGQFTAIGTYDTLRFFVGLSSIPNAAAPGAVTPTTHPLSYNSDSSNWSATEGYVFNSLQIIPDTVGLADGEAITRDINVTNNGNLKEVKLAYPVTLEFGFDVSVPIKIDYEKWLEGIDFVGDSAEVIINTIVTNTPNAFSIIE